MAKTKKTSTGRRKATAGHGKKRGQTSKSATKTTKKTARKTTKKATQKAEAAGSNKKTKTTTVKKSPLDKKHLDEFREILLQKRRTLMGDVNGLEEHSNNSQNGGNLSSMPTHMADIGTDNFEHEFTLGLIESEQSLLKEINRAMQRIETGMYGVCLGTGQRIPITRLRAKPWAKYTVKFAQMIEEGQVKEPDETVPEEK